MRISRKRRPKKSLIPRFNKNQFIQAKEVRVLDVNGENLGVFAIGEALAKARDEEMDLVEINPKSEPPVCQIIDFTNFKYQKEKEARKQKAKTHIADLKGIRLSMRISEHDLEVRQAQAEKFLSRGDKVKIEIIMRGRERGKAHIGQDVIRDFVSRLEQKHTLRYDQEIARQESKITAIVAKK